MVFLKNITVEVVFGRFSTSWYVADAALQSAPSIPERTEHSS